jgi:hypothetical protein
MKTFFLIVALTVTVVSVGFADQQEETLEPDADVLCLAYLPTLELSGAQSYTGILTEIINWSLTYSDDDTYELSSKEEIQTVFAIQLAANPEVLLDDTIAISDAFYRQLAKYEIINTSGMTSVKIKDVRYTQDVTIEGAEYEVTFGVTSEVETPEESGNYKQTNYEITIGLVYVFDTCSGEGYVPGPTGVKTVTDKAGNVVMNVKVVQ